MKHNYLSVVLVASLGSVLSATLAAEEINKNTTAHKEAARLEELVVVGQLGRFGATKSAVPILETARSITIVTEQTFREFGALTLDDTLNYSSGVIGDSFGFSTRGDFPKIRGFDAAEYRDGQQVLFGYYNNTRSDVYFLEQVEVLKGPASVLYGKGTPGGIVNAISKLAGPGKDNEVIVEVGENSRAQLSADLNIALTENLFARAVAIYRDSDTQVDHVPDDAVGFMPSITFQNDKTSLTAMLEYMDRESDTAGQFLPINATGCLSGDVSISPASFCANANGPELDRSAFMGHPDFNRYNSESLLGSILASHQINDRLEVEGVIRYKDADVEYNQAWIDFAGAGNPRIDAAGNGARTFYLNVAGSRQWAVDLRARWSLETGALSHEFVGGVAYQNVVTDSDYTYLFSQDVINVYNPVNGPIPALLQSGEPLFNAPASLSEEHGVYINDQISIDNWKINLGVRYDDTRSGSAGSDAQTDYALSSSAGVLYAFDNGISPYISYAESFEPVLGTDGFTSNPLKPREGEQWEVGVKYQPVGTSTYITLAWFDIEESNLPNPSSLIGAPDSQQEGVGTSKGVELEVFTVLGDDFTLEFNLTLLDTESAEGEVFDSIPEEQFSSWISYRPSGALEGFKSGFGVRYVGENESNNVAANVRVKTDGYVLYDAMLGYELERWDLTLNLRNLTDEEYYSTCLARGDCFPGEERSIVGRAAYRF